MEKEIWKPVVGYEGFYEVSNLGRVRSLDRKFKTRQGRIISVKGQPIKADPSKRSGYVQVHLSNNGDRRTYQLHRVVAKSFVENPENKPEINHKDGIKTNNRADNLEWVTPSENQIHSRDVLHRKYYGKPVVCVETGETFENAAEAARQKGMKTYKHICSCCKGRRERTGGYHWKYTEGASNEHN